MEQTRAALLRFVREAREARRANQSQGGGGGTALELLLAPLFHRLVEAALSEHLPAPPAVLPEFRKRGVGRPDLAFARPGQPARAFLELKIPGHPLLPAGGTPHDRRQFERFASLPLWAWCNFHAIKLIRRGTAAQPVFEAEAVVVPAAALDLAATTDAAAERLALAHDPAGFVAILSPLASAAPPAVESALDAARALAFAARLARDTVQDIAEAELPEALRDVRTEFEKTLFAKPRAGGREGDDPHALFADAFAQTLAFGLLLAREAAGGAEVAEGAHRHLPRGTLLWATLRALTVEEVLDALGAAFDVLRDTVNAIPPERLAPGADGRDPILYFYEDFLATYDRKARQQYGVYYTPPELVEFIVARADAALREGLGTEGLRDPQVRFLDPACGTGTFPVAAVKAAAERAEREAGPAARAAAASGVAERFGALELLVGPYTIAHWRMGREVRGRGGVLPVTRNGEERLPIWLADTLAPPADTPLAPAVLGFLANPMVAERRGADRLKRDEPILCVLGNPPYRRLRRGEAREMVGGWMDGLWDDLKRPVREAGAGRSLNAFPDLYVAFWRWALWRLFEAPGAPKRGVVSFVTNRGFLAGRAFGGLRRMLRERFDEIEVLDLRGDSRGALPEGAGRDENVFNIQTGVCVTTAWATGARRAGGQARVRYADVWDARAFDRAGKLAALREAAREGGAEGWRAPAWRALPQGGMADLKPLGFRDADWPSLREVFSFASNGVVTYRDDFAYATRREVLERRVKGFLAAAPEAAKKAFKDSARNTAARAQGVPFDERHLGRVGYRPLDRRWAYLHQHYVDRMRDPLQATFASGNVALMALEDGTGSGPAVWCHGLVPDQHAFNNRGGWIFPLRNPAEGEAGHFVRPALLAGLALAYGEPPTPQQVFDAALALLSAPSYAQRFARDLEDALPHVPFPSDAELFRRIAKRGATIRAIQTAPRWSPLSRDGARLEGEPAEPGRGLARLDMPRPGEAWQAQGPDHGFVRLQKTGTLRLANLDPRVWAFEVSGYRVLCSWLRARDGELLDETLQSELLDLATRLRSLVGALKFADWDLETCLAERPLTRAGLLLPTPPAFGDSPADEGDDEEDEEE